MARTHGTYNQPLIAQDYWKMKVDKILRISQLAGLSMAYVNYCNIFDY